MARVRGHLRRDVHRQPRPLHRQHRVPRDRRRTSPRRRSPGCRGSSARTRSSTRAARAVRQARRPRRAPARLPRGARGLHARVGVVRAARRRRGCSSPRASSRRRARRRSRRPRSGSSSLASRPRSAPRSSAPGPRSAASAPAMGPPLGGLLVSFSWHWIFVINVPLGLLCLALVGRYFAEIRDRPGGSPTAWARCSRSGASGCWRWVWRRVPTGAGTGGSSCAWRARWSSAAARRAVAAAPRAGPRARSAALAGRSRSRAWRRSCSSPGSPGCCSATCCSSPVSGATRRSRRVWRSRPGPILAATSAVLSGRLADRIGSPAVLGIPGGVLFALGASFYLRLPPEPHYLTHFLPGSILTGTGVGLSLPALTASALLAVPGPALATGVATSTAFRQIGAALGVATWVAVHGTPGPRERARRVRPQLPARRMLRARRSRDDGGAGPAAAPDGLRGRAGRLATGLHRRARELTAGAVRRDEGLAGAADADERDDAAERHERRGDLQSEPECLLRGGARRRAQPRPAAPRAATGRRPCRAIGGAPGRRSRPRRASSRTPSSRPSSAEENCAATAAPIAAVASRPATRAIALLTAEAIPALPSSASASTAAVSGATVIDSPSEKSSSGGSTSVRNAGSGDNRDSHEDPGGRDERAEAHERSRPDAVGERPEAPREQEHHDRARHGREAGLDRLVARDLLQVQHEQEEHDAQPRVHREGQQVAHREVAPPEQIEVEHRVRRVGLPEHEGDEQRDAGEPGAERPAGRPSRAAAAR